MEYKNLIRGEIGIINKIPFKIDLQTCVGTIIYGNKIVGAAHGLIPSGIGSNYENPLIITPKGIEELTKLILARNKGASLNAILAGGKIESSKIGLENAQQAREILKKLKIPVKIDFTKSNLWDTSLRVYPNKFELSALDYPFRHIQKYQDL